MPIQLISIGPPTTLIQNQVYALPAQLVNITTSAACEVSVNQSTWVAYVSGSNTSASFIRSAGVNTVITCKSATKGSSSGSKLPTAPLQRVLISQGDGVDPIFSIDADVLGTLSGSHVVVTGFAVIAGSIRLAEHTVASLPTGTALGDLANFSDSTVNTPGSTIVGGGANHVLGRWNGANWKVVGA